MITRIVKMQFRTGETEDFLRFFDTVKEAIRGREGCLELKLLRDIQDQDIVFTYSKWRAEEDLESYRHSELFKDTWKKTKIRFSDRAKAWSTQELHSL